MIIITSEDTDRADEKVASIGFFDGVHAGHRFLIDELKAIADKNNKKSMAITFSEHPQTILNPGFGLELLTTTSEKTALLDSTGLDYCLLLNFTKEMANLSARDFLKVIKDQYAVTTLIVGYDHRFGHDRKEGFNDYVASGAELGIQILEGKRYYPAEHRIVSSSEIRNLLKQGDIDKANQLLTREYTLSGTVIEGDKIGRNIGFPTANLQPEKDKLIPQRGVYAVLIKYNEVYYKGMMNIGVRPTINNRNNLRVEVNIFDFKDNIYSKKLEIHFVERIRNEKKFASLEELKSQLKKDKIATEKILKSK